MILDAQDVPSVVPLITFPAGKSMAVVHNLVAFQVRREIKNGFDSTGPTTS